MCTLVFNKITHCVRTMCYSTRTPPNQTFFLSCDETRKDWSERGLFTSRCYFGLGLEYIRMAHSLACPHYPTQHGQSFWSTTKQRRVKEMVHGQRTISIQSPYRL